jgi:hypothetical protein
MRRLVPFFVLLMPTFIAGQAPSPMDTALVALDEFRDLVQVHAVHQDNYREKLAELVPMLAPFMKNPSEEWRDVRMAMEYAVRQYEASFANRRWTESFHVHLGDVAVVYAKQLAKDREAERARREQPLTRQLVLPGTVEGRFGYGDREMPPEIERESAGAYYDVLEVDVPRPGLLTFDLRTPYSGAHLALLDTSGDIMDRVLSPNGYPRMQQPVVQGKYTV